MVSKGDKWVRIFDVPDVSNHKKGFTIYKVISMLYPESCPDAITKITVWKRYNEFKKLHREVKTLHKNLKIKEKMPTLPNSPFFKRFDTEIIEERRQGILNFLEFTAKQPKIFTSNVFVKFFQTSHTPADMLQSNINEIRAELSLPNDSDNFPFNSHSSDDEHTVSDTDSVCTLSSINTTTTADLQSDPLFKSSSSLTRLSKRQLQDSQDTLSLNIANDVVDKNIFPTPPPTPNCDTISSQYILDAANYISSASQHESNKNYEQAFTEYKSGIDILLKNVKNDKNIDRREMVRFKIEKYLLRAEKIYNMHLSSEIKNITQYVASKEVPKVDNFKPLSELYKYKVVKIISSGMVVLHSENQKLYYVKVIQKTTTFNRDHLILPEQVPYMVRLHNFYNCENALFLVLQYCNGVKLKEHLNQKSLNSSFCADSLKQERDFLLRRERKETEESDCSYAELINDYACSKNNINNSKELVESKSSSSSREYLKDFEVVSMYEEPVDIIEPKCDEQSLDTTEQILEKSQKLLSHIDLTLQKNENEKHTKLITNKQKKKEKFDSKLESSKTTNTKVEQRKLLKRHSSEFYDDFEEIDSQSLAGLKDIVKWASQIVVALEKLHILGVICCDLNMNKLLVDSEEDIVMTYACNIYEHISVHNLNNKVSLAPELYSYNQITNSVDFWSFGIILYELLVGIPFQNIHPEIINNHTCVKIPKSIVPEGRSILKQLLCFNPKDRLGAGVNGIEELKSHPFFNGVDWNSLHSKYLL